MMTNKEAHRTVGAAAVIVACDVADDGSMAAYVELRTADVATLLAHRWMRAGGAETRRQIVADAVGEACEHDAVTGRASRIELIRAIGECAAEVCA